MSCAGTDATQRVVNFQRWPLAENSLGGRRGEPQNLCGVAGAEVWATSQQQPGRGGPNQKGVCSLCGLARGGLGRAPGEDGSFVTLVFPGAMAANGGNSITPV